jgi:hypothetical protein
MSAATPFRFMDKPVSPRETGTLVVVVPRMARGKQKLLGVLADRLKFPSYYGWNWDALEECLRDLSWLRNVKRVSIVHESVPLSPRGEQLGIYLQLLADVVGGSNEARKMRIEVVFPTELQALIEQSLQSTSK